jgi:hypothetical protein
VADVFLSYDREDVARAERVANVLAECGWSVWWDRKMRAGPSFRRVIADELDHARCVVVLWSNRSINSDWVCEEAEEAQKRAILVPALLDDIRPPLGFRQHQTANLVGWDGDTPNPELEVLKDGIRHHVTPKSIDHASGRSSAASKDAPATRLRTGMTARAIFLSYRSDQSAAAVGRVYDRLMDTYGSQSLFVDSCALPLGVDPVVYIEQQLQRCSAILVMIGSDWSRVTDHQGNRLLDDPQDLVRVGIATALKQRKHIIPVLIQNATMPQENELPEEIRFLAGLSGISVHTEKWLVDIEQLVTELDRL